MDGPASRHGQFGPNPAEDTDEDEDEDGADAPTSSVTNASTAGAQVPSSHEAPNDFETVIGVDTASEEPEVNLFTTMQNKLQLLTSESQKPTKASEKAEEAPTARVTAQEQIKSIVVDLQDIS